MRHSPEPTVKAKTAIVTEGAADSAVSFFPSQSHGSVGIWSWVSKFKYDITGSEELLVLQMSLPPTTFYIHMEWLVRAWWHRLLQIYSSPALLPEWVDNAPVQYYYIVMLCHNYTIYIYHFKKFVNSVVHKIWLHLSYLALRITKMTVKVYDFHTIFSKN